MSKIPHQALSEGSLEALLVRFRDHGDTAALTELFDTAAPGLRRLARRLTGPRRHDLADDALQETFLALVERPERFDASRRLLPWLATVLVNRLRRLQERESRVVDEARLTEREVDSPEDAALYSELAAHVESEVKKLPPTVREAVSGKILRGEEIDVLSAELGISSGAFRVRLHRGLNKLRAALPKGVLGALGALGLRDRSYAAIRSSVLRAGGAPAAASSVGIWIGVVVAVVVTSGGVWWMSQPEKELSNRELAANRSEGELEDDTARSTPVALTEPQPLPAGSSNRNVAGALRGTLRVSVVNRDGGEPREGIEVLLRYRPDAEVSELVASTDARGVVDFAVQPYGELFLLKVKCGGPTSATVSSLSGVLRPGEVREETLRVGEGGAISGRVVDTDWNAIPGALVEAWCSQVGSGSPIRSVRADEKGRFTIETLGPEFLLRASAEGLVSHTGLRGSLADGAHHQDQELMVSPSVTLHGLVVDESGDPLPYARAQMLRDSDQQLDGGLESFRDAEGEAVTDEEGRFVISGLPSARRRVTIEHEAFERAAFDFDSPFEEEKTFSLQRALTVKGRILDADGDPARGALIRGWPRHNAAYQANSWIKADEEGRFTMLGFARPQAGYSPPPGLAIRHDGYALNIFDLNTPVGDPGEEVVVRLRERAKSISGVVVDAAGTPLPGREVRVVGTRLCNTGVRWVNQESTWEFAAELSDVRTNENGEFRFDQLYPGTFELRVYDVRDRKRFATMKVVAGSEGVEFALTEASLQKVVLIGQVRTASTSDPVSEFSIHPMRELEDGSGEGYTFDFTEETGEFRIEGLQPARYTLVAKAEGFAEEKKAVQYLSVGEHRVLFNLVPATTLRLKLDPEGHTQGGFKVSARSLTGQTLSLQKARGTGTHESFRNGEATLVGLPAERVILTVESDHATQEIEVDLSVPVEEPLLVRFDPLPVLPVHYRVVEVDSDLTLEELQAQFSNTDREAAKTWWQENQNRFGPPLGDFQLKFHVGSAPAFSEHTFKSLGGGNFSYRAKSTYPTFRTMSSESGEGSAPAGWLTAPSASLRVEVESDYYAAQEILIELDENPDDNPDEKGPPTLILLQRP